MTERYNPLCLAGKNILVTGAASGIGKATSLLLSKLGANLLLIDLNEIELNATIDKCSSNVIGLVLDITKSEVLKEKISRVVAEFGKLNGITHLAGKPSIVPLKTMSQKICTDIFQINTYPAIELSRIFINRNIFAGGSGSIVLISSVYGLVGSSANVAYATSKAALHGVTKSLAIELAPKNIRVNCIAPGFIKTEMMSENKKLFNDDYMNSLSSLHPLGLGEPDDVAYAIAFLLSDVSKWITGSILSVDGGFTAQ